MTGVIRWAAAVLALAAGSAPAARAEMVPWSFSTKGGQTEVTWQIFGDQPGPQDPGKAYLVLTGVAETALSGERHGILLGGASLRVDEPGTAMIFPGSRGGVGLDFTLTDVTSGESATLALGYSLELSPQVAAVLDASSFSFEKTLGDHCYHVTVNGLVADVAVSPKAEPNPEPATLLLGSLGCAGAAVVSWVRRRRDDGSGPHDGPQPLPA